MNTVLTAEEELQKKEREAKLKRGVWKTVLSIVIVSSLFMGLFLNKIMSTRILSPAELRANGAIVFEQPRMIKDFELIDHKKQPFTKAELNGHWSLVYFGFTHCPDICPTTLTKLDEVITKLDGDFAEQVSVLMVSVDPARDTPEKLAEYVPYFNPTFEGVTGEFIAVMSLARNVNVAFNKVMLSGDDYTIDHTGNLVLINPRGDYHGFFKPPFELSRLKVTLQSIMASHP